MSLRELLSQRRMGFQILGRVSPPVEFKKHDGYKVRFHHLGRDATVKTFVPAGAPPPTAEQVLSSLIRDELVFLSLASMEEFAGRFGFNLARAHSAARARRLYNALEVGHRRLVRLLGKHYQAFLDAVTSETRQTVPLDKSVIPSVE